MHDRSRALPLLMSAVVGLLIVTAADGAFGQNATIMRIAGGVTHRVGASGQFSVSRAGTQLPVASRVRTDSTGRAEIALPSGAVIRMFARTDLVIQSATGSHVTRGQIYARLVAGIATQVSGPTATVGVRGTTLELTVAEDDTTTVTVGEGEVEFFNDLGRVIVMTAQQSVARPGEAPSRPIAVDPDSLMAWEATIGNLMIEVEPPPQMDIDPERLDEALRQRQAAVLAAPTDAAAQAELARVLLDLRRVEEAVAAAEIARAGAPGVAEYQGLLGWTLLQAGRLDEAEEAFATAAEGEPGNARWLVGRALVALAADRPNDAAPLLRAAVQTAPDDPQPQAYLAAAELRLGDLDSAADAAEAAVRIGPAHSIGHVYLAHVRLLQGDLTGAINASATATRLASTSSAARTALGTAHFFAGDTEAARPELEEAVELNPLSARARLALAKLLAAEGEIEAALEQGRAAVSMNPTSAPARSTLGLLLLLSNDPWAASEQFSLATELDPELAEARTGWAQALTRRGRFREAMGQQRVALSLDTDSASSLNNLGGIYAARGEFDAAIEHLQRATELQPGWGMPCANLALVYLEQARYADALAAGERAVELGERSPFVHTVLARIYGRQGRTDRALAALRQAVALDPDYPQAQFQLARLYLEQDRAQDAMRAILSALTADPSAMLESRLYARSEASLAAGSHESWHAEAFTSGQAADGQLSFHAGGMYDDRTGWRSVNQERTESLVELIGGHQADADSRLVFYGSWFDSDAGLPGPATPAFPGDPDDRMSFAGWDALLAWQRRLSTRVTATAKYAIGRSEFGLTDPGALTGADASPFRRLDHTLTAHRPEIQLEADLADNARLRAGWAWQFGDEDQSGVVGVVDPGTGEAAFEPFANSISPKTQTAWIEVEGDVSERMSLLAGVRWGREEGAPSVSAPRIVARYRPDDATWLALTLEPIFRADIAQLLPVEPLADPFGLRALNFIEGGVGRSWTLRYQRDAGPDGTLTGALAYQDVEGLLIDIQNPSLTGLPQRTLIGRGHRWVADLAYEQWLADGITGRLWLRRQDSEGSFPELGLTGGDWPYVPRWQAGGRMDYLDRAGWRVGLEGVWVGERTDDPAGAVVVPDYLLVNLDARYQRTMHESYFIQVRNLTDESYQIWLGYPESRMAIYAGVEYRR